MRNPYRRKDEEWAQEMTTCGEIILLTHTTEELESVGSHIGNDSILKAMPTQLLQTVRLVYGMKQKSLKLLSARIAKTQESCESSDSPPDC